MDWTPWTGECSCDGERIHVGLQWGTKVQVIGTQVLVIGTERPCLATHAISLLVIE